MRRTLVIAVLALCVTSGLAFAQMRQQPRPQAAQGPVAGQITEKLLLNPPPGWQSAGTSSTKNSATTHLFPPGQTAEKWNEMLTIQVMGDSQADAREHIQRIVEASRTNCEASGLSPVTEGLSNGYPVSTMTVTCTKGRNSGLGGLVAVKAIRGAQALYVVERIWRGPAFERNEAAPVSPEMLQEWSAFLRAVAVCDDADQAHHPCPK